MSTVLDKKVYRNRVSSLSAKPLPLDYKGHKCDYTICPHPKEEQTLYPCSPGYVYDRFHGKRWIAKCGSYDCSDCGYGKVKAFEHKAEWFQKFHTRNELVKNVLVTLTFRSKCDEDCNLHWSKCIDMGHSKTAIGAKGKPIQERSRVTYFNRFMQDLRAHLNKHDLNLEYCKAKEPTQAGVRHWHMIVGNVSRTWSEAYLNSLVKELWHKHTKNSFYTDVQDTYGKPEKYLSKYMDKNYQSFPFDKGERRYSFSRGAMLPPVIARRYQVEAQPSRYTPFQQAFIYDPAIGDHEHPYHTKPKFVKKPSHIKGGEVVSRQPCSHYDCDLLLHHTDLQVDSFEMQGGYPEMMEWYLAMQPEEIQKLTHYDDFYGDPEPEFDWTKEYPDYEDWL